MIYSPVSRYTDIMLYKVVDCASEWIDLDGGELSVSEYLRELLDLFFDSKHVRPPFTVLLGVQFSRIHYHMETDVIFLTGRKVTPEISVCKMDLCWCVWAVTVMNRTALQNIIFGHCWRCQ